MMQASKTWILLCLVFAVHFFVGILNFSGAESASRSGFNNLAGGGNSYAGSMNWNGRIIAFLSDAKDLVTNGNTGPYLDVFAHNFNRGVTSLISVDLNGVRGGNGNSSAPSVSSNGYLIVFHSAASNLILNDTNNCDDVFLRALGLERTTLVSVRGDEGGPGNGASRWAKISADERFVVFESLASDLVLADGNGTNDVFVRDLAHGTTQLISVNTNGAS